MWFLVSGRLVQSSHRTCSLENAVSSSEHLSRDIWDLSVCQWSIIQEMNVKAAIQTAMLPECQISLAV